RPAALGTDSPRVRRRPGGRDARRGPVARPAHVAASQGSSGRIAGAGHPDGHQRRSEHRAHPRAVRPRQRACRPTTRRTQEDRLMNRFLDLADFPREEVRDLLDLAARLQQHPQPQALAGKVLGLLFLNPSLRTLASFQSAMMRLGGTAVVITPGQGTWQMETRSGAIMKGAAAERVREAVRVLASYCDAMGIRMFAEGRNLQPDLAETGFNMMADLCDKPLVNMESAVSHPCQALADWHTMDELRVPE